MICSGFFYIWPFTILIFLFRPFQLFGVKRFLCLISFLCYCLDSLYRVSLRALTLSVHVSISSFLARFPLHAIFIICVSLELYVVTNHFCPRSRTIKKTFLVPSTDGTCLFYFPTGTKFLLFSLSILRRKQSQIFIRSFCAYHWSRFEDVLSHLCSAII